MHTIFLQDKNDLGFLFWQARAALKARIIIGESCQPAKRRNIASQWQLSPQELLELSIAIKRAAQQI